MPAVDIYGNCIKSMLCHARKRAKAVKMTKTYLWLGTDLLEMYLQYLIHYLRSTDDQSHDRTCQQDDTVLLAGQH